LISHLVDGDVVDSCFDVKQYGGQDKENHVSDDSYTAIMENSFSHQMTYLETLDSAVKFNTEAVETLSEKVKDIMLD